MRALFIAPKSPHPPDTGSRQRLWNILLALRSVADVDVFIAGNGDAQALEESLEELGGRKSGGRVVVVRPTSKPKSPANVLRWLREGDLPSTLWFRDLRDVNAALTSSMQPPYDVVWVACPIGVVLLRGISMGPMVVDLDDLEDQVLRGAVRHDPAFRRPDRRVRAAYDITRWRRLTDETVRRAARVVVCSSEDARRVASRNVVVVPNGVDRPAHAVGSLAAHDPPTLLFHGQMTYPPNADGAMHFVHQVLPHILAEMPRAQFRIVGRCDDAVAQLGSHPNVTVTGYVPDMELELARADIVVVPLRFGSGTRLKIIEAFAQRVPVVSTTIGAEGLGTTAGTELLIADGDVQLAAACVQLLSDVPLRHALTSSAEALYAERFQWSAIREQAAAVATEVANQALSGA